MKWKMKKTTWVFLCQMYGKFWSISLELFIEHKPSKYEKSYSCCKVLGRFLNKVFPPLWYALDTVWPLAHPCIFILDAASSTFFQANTSGGNYLISAFNGGKILEALHNHTTMHGPWPLAKFNVPISISCTR